MKRRVLQFLLTFLAKQTLKKYHPDVIAITGSIGKTSTKEACYLLLSEKFRVRKSEKNFNTEIGVPLAIIGEERSPGSSLAGWGLLIARGFARLLSHSKTYPEILILELAADKPGDVRSFMEYVVPKIGIITTISEVHLSKFKKLSHIVAEKRHVIEHTPAEGYAVLNFDDPLVKKTAEKTSARLFTFGVDDTTAAVRADEVKVIKKGDEVGLFFKLLYQETATPLFVPRCPRHLVYGLLAAASCGFIYGMTALDIVERLALFTPLSGRFFVQKNKDGVWIIDDAYNAATVSVLGALESLMEFPIAGRRIAVLGDMLELGSASEKGHRSIGEHAAELGVDALFTYGNESQFICDAALEAGFPKKQTEHFNDQALLIGYLKKTIEPGDVILVKGSRAMKMEQIVAALME